MNFKELSKQHYVLGQGAISFTVIDLEIFGTLRENGKDIVHEFINSPEDFEVARKYVEGYQAEHINEFGKTNVEKIYGFGPYLIDLLESEDYRKISIGEFENQCVEILSRYNINRGIEFAEFMGNLKNVFKNVKLNSHDFYQLLPPEWKYNDISPFQLSDYLCGFSINRVDGTFTVIQIDDD